MALGTPALLTGGTGGTSTDATSYALNGGGSLTFVANTIYLLAVASGHSTAGSTLAPNGFTGTHGQTWVSIGTIVNTTDKQRMSLYRCKGVGATGTMTITFASGQEVCQWQIIGITGADLSGTSGSGAIAQSKTGTDTDSSPALTLNSAIGPASVVLGFFHCNSGSTSHSAGANYTQLAAVSHFSSPASSFFTEYDMGGTTTVNATLGASFASAIIGVEVKEATVTPGPILATLFDDFPSTLDTAKWNVTQGTAVTESGQLKMTSTTSYTLVDSDITYDCTDAYIFWKASPPTPYSSTYDTGIAFMADANNYVEMYMGASTTVHCRVVTAGTPSDSTFAYVNATMLWFRMRHSGTTIYYDTSPDGVTWTQQTTRTCTWAVTNCTIQIFAGRGAGSDGFAYFDNFNVGPLIGIVTDTFPTTLDAQWTVQQGTAVTDTGRLKLTANTGYSRVQRHGLYDLRSGGVYAKVDPATPTGSFATGLFLFLASDSSGNYAEMYIGDTSQTVMRIHNDGVQDITTIAYSSTNHAWLRMLNSGSDLLFQTAPDPGTVWTTRETFAIDWPITGVVLELFAGRWAGSDAFGYIDNVNTPGLIIVAGSDTLGAGITETVATIVVAATVDTPTLGITEVSSAAVTVSTTETPVLGVTETTSILTALAMADALVVGLTETTSILTALAVVDALQVVVAEVSAIMASLATTDVLMVAATETVSISATLAVADALVAEIVETTFTLTIQAVADALVAGTTETTSISTILTVVETLQSILTEVAAIVTQVSTTDTLAGEITETSSLLVALSTVDALAIILVELASVMDAPSASDTLALSVAETTAIAASLAVVDALQVSLAEVSSILVTLSALNTLAATITEATTTQAVAAATDALAVTLVEAMALVALVATTDALAMAVTEATATQALQAAIDTLAEVITDASAMALTISTVDTLIIEVGDVAVSAVLVDVTDTLLSELIEVTALFVSLSGTETLGLTLVDAVAIAAVLAGIDTLAQEVTETASIQVVQAAADVGGLGVAEAVALLAVLSDSDNLQVSLTEVAAVLAFVGATDTLGMSLLLEISSIGDTAVVGLDGLALTSTDTSSIAVVVPGADSAALGLTETSQSLLVSVALDALALGLADAALAVAVVSKADGMALAVLEADVVGISVVGEETIVLTWQEVAALPSQALDGADALALTLTDVVVVILPHGIRGRSIFSDMRPMEEVSRDRDMAEPPVSTMG